MEHLLHNKLYQFITAIRYYFLNKDEEIRIYRDLKLGHGQAAKKY